MPCCGERRRSLAQSLARPVKPAVQAVASKSAVNVRQGSMQAASAPLLVHYVGNASVVVRGPVTNKPYAFSARGSAMPVDPRDAVILLRSNMFLRA
jgi:hypothetical protein